MKRKYARYEVACESGSHYTIIYKEAFRFYQSCRKQGESATLYGVNEMGEYTTIFSC